MMKFYKLIEYAYLAFALFFLIEAFRIWEAEENKAYLYLGFVVIAVFMFFFRRKFRRRQEKDKK
ncbi:MAG TPA: hypothetical protein VFM70_05955 [Salinimicrobium sp.]|nr:hypothetical protein [Salinimicrobium sp.]